MDKFYEQTDVYDQLKWEDQVQDYYASQKKMNNQFLGYDVSNRMNTIGSKGKGSMNMVKH